jgi:hypothetical protein
VVLHRTIALPLFQLARMSEYQLWPVEEETEMRTGGIGIIGVIVIVLVILWLVGAIKL